MKNTAKKELLSRSEGHLKAKKTPDLTRGGKSNDIAHFSFILVFTVPVGEVTIGFSTVLGRSKRVIV